MKLSIIIPSFNQGRFIAETIESCLQQDYKEFEILVQDGASCDETISVLERFNDPRLSWVSEKDAGVADAVNRGLDRVTGDVVAFQSSDDVYLPGAFTAMVEAFRSNPSTFLFFGDIELIDEYSSLLGQDVQGPFKLTEYLGRLSYVPQPAAFFRRECLGAVGGWRPEVSYVADADFWLRISTRFNVAHIPRLVARYRYHSSQRDRHTDRILNDWIRCIDDLVRSQHLSDRERRFARMGQALAVHRYTPESQWWLRTVALYRAYWACPEALFDSRAPKRQLFPARDPIWAGLSAVKQQLKKLIKARAT